MGRSRKTLRLKPHAFPPPNDALSRYGIPVLLTCDCSDLTCPLRIDTKGLSPTNDPAPAADQEQEVAYLLPTGWYEANDPSTGKTYYITTTTMVEPHGLSPLPTATRTEPPPAALSDIALKAGWAEATSPEGETYYYCSGYTTWEISDDLVIKHAKLQAELDTLKPCEVPRFAEIHAEFKALGVTP